MKDSSVLRKKRIRRILIIVPVGFLIFILCAAGTLFSQELKITGSIKKVEDEKTVYYMEIDGDYYFDEFLSSGGAASDAEVSAFLTEKISKGFYSVDVEASHLGCSTVSAMSPDGGHVWGRNFDWTKSVAIIVKCVPDDGYASISTCNFQNITGSPDTLPEGFFNKMLAISALYVPMDGINQAGLCVADLEVNEGGMASVDTGRADLTVTTAIRLLLNKAASVEEAAGLLEQYDIHPSGGISHHISVSDASGASAVFEFTNSGMTVVDTNVVTNFNLANGDVSAGGESAKERYEYLSSLYDEKSGVLSAEEVKEALSRVSQSEGRWTTQWSVVYEQSALTAKYYFDCDFDNAHSFSIPVGS